jgi:uncharacterized protein YdhG (YjbR/CyaY superfamily)
MIMKRCFELVSVGGMVCLIGIAPVMASTKIVGNGGDAVFCPSPSGSSALPHVELLDLFEARSLRGIQEVPSSGMSHLEVLSRVLNDVKRRMPNVAESWRYEMDFFFKNVRFLQGQRLVDVPDSMHVAVPGGCELRQLAIQREPVLPGDMWYTVDQDLWDLLSENHKAALVLHEVLYRRGLAQGASDSATIRYLVALLLADQFQTKTDKDLFEMFFLAHQPTVEFSTADWSVESSTGLVSTSGQRRRLGLGFDRATGRVQFLKEPSVDSNLVVKISIGSDRLLLLPDGSDLTLRFYEPVGGQAGFVSAQYNAAQTLPTWGGFGQLSWIQFAVIGMGPRVVDELKSAKIGPWTLRQPSGLARSTWARLAQRARSRRVPTFAEIQRDFGGVYSEVRRSYRDAADLANDLGIPEVVNAGGVLPGQVGPSLELEFEHTAGLPVSVSGQVRILPPSRSQEAFRWASGGRADLTFADGDRFLLKQNAQVGYVFGAAQASGWVQLPWGKKVFLDSSRGSGTPLASLPGHHWFVEWDIAGELTHVRLHTGFTFGLKSQFKVSTDAGMSCRPQQADCVINLPQLEGIRRSPSAGGRFEIYQVSSNPCKIRLDRSKGRVTSMECNGEIRLEAPSGPDLIFPAGKAVQFSLDEWPLP